MCRNHFPSNVVYLNDITCSSCITHRNKLDSGHIHNPKLKYSQPFIFVSAVCNMYFVVYRNCGE